MLILCLNVRVVERGQVARLPIVRGDIVTAGTDTSVAATGVQ